MTKQFFKRVSQTLSLSGIPRAPDGYLYVSRVTKGHGHVGIERVESIKLSLEEAQVLHYELGQFLTQVDGRRTTATATTPWIVLFLLGFLAGWFLHG